jgi:phosphatidylglycerophosphatase A
MRRLGLFVATCGYLGFVPIAPGTFGSAAGLALFGAVRLSGSAGVELGAIVVLLAVGVWSGGVAERYFGGVDPAPVVLDEVVGMLITLAFIPVNMLGAIAGFFVFRLYDVIKPWPANRFEALPGGLGVMADDAMAAVYANLTLRLVIALSPAGWLA